LLHVCVCVCVCVHALITGNNIVVVPLENIKIVAYAAKRALVML